MCAFFMLVYLGFRCCLLFYLFFFLKTEKERAWSWVGSSEAEKIYKEGEEKRL